MEYHQVGQSDLKVSAITFGAWAIGGWMWGGADENDAVAAIRKAIDLGVTTIDTAAVYGFGRSEEIVAKAVAGKRDKVQILTKYGLRWDEAEGEFHFEMRGPAGERVPIYKNARAGSVMRECEQSLKRLRTDYIDLYQCHWRDSTTPVEETMGAMDKLMKAGKIRAVGLSNFSVEDIDAARKIVPIASDQPPYSMVLRNAEKDVIPFCRENQIGVIVYSPLQRGLLTGKIKPGHRFAEGDHRAGMKFFQARNVEKVLKFLDELRPIADAHRATLAQLVINWTIHRPGITAALVGARDPKQAEENAKAADLRLSEEETRRIDELLEDLKLDV